MTAVEPQTRDIESLLQAAAHASAIAGSDNESDHGDGEDPEKRKKRPRACQACRNMKIKCISVDGQDACQACAKVNRQCVMPGPAKKRQKTVHKVAELEKKIDALTQSLIAKQQSHPTPPQDSPSVHSAGRSSVSVPAQQQNENLYNTVPPPPLTQNLYQTSGSTLRKPGRDIEATDYVDVIRRGLLSLETAQQIFDNFCATFNPLLPLVVFPPGTTVETLRKTRPFLLLAVLASACGTCVPHLDGDLHEELARQVAERVFFHFEKSLDLIQTMLLMSTWLAKHRHAKDFGFNYYIHCAVVMAHDLGLGKRSKIPTWTNKAEEYEMRRTYLACYYSAITASNTMRTPAMVKQSPYIQDCVDYLENSPMSQPCDMTLCSLIRMVTLMEDVAATFHMDDPAATVDLRDSAVRYQLKLFEKRQSEWKAAAAPFFMPQLLEFLDAVCSVFIHEISLYDDHNIKDFPPPKGLSAVAIERPTSDMITPFHLEALSICVKNMIKAMDTLLEVFPKAVHALPCIFLVWTAYCVAAMIRLQGTFRLTGSKYSDVFLPDFRIQHYLDCVISALQEHRAVYPANGQLQQAFQMLKAWHNHRMYGKISTQNQDTDELRRGLLITQKDVEEFHDKEGNVGNNMAPLTPGQNVDFLSGNMPIDASAFENQDWDFTLEDLNNFEQSMGQPAGGGWLGYLI